MENLEELLRPCPFCNSNHEDRWAWITRLKDARYVLSHYCYPNPDEVVNTITVYGDSPEQCIERWNANGKKHSTE